MSYIGSGAAPKATAIDNDTVETADIKDGAVTAGKMATGAAASNLGSYVSSVNTQTGAVTLTKTDVGLSNVQNVDQTNAANLTSGTIPDARFPATLPAASGANLTSLNADNIASGTVPAARLGSGTANSTTFLRGDNTWATVSTTPTTSQVLSATAGASAGAVGTYGFLQNINQSIISFGSTLAGSNLRPVSIRENGSYFVGPGNVLSGTWRCMGIAYGDNQPSGSACLWLRIS